MGWYSGAKLLMLSEVREGEDDWFDIAERMIHWVDGESARDV